MVTLKTQSMEDRGADVGRVQPYVDPLVNKIWAIQAVTYCRTLRLSSHERPQYIECSILCEHPN